MSEVIHRYRPYRPRAAVMRHVTALSAGMVGAGHGGSVGQDFSVGIEEELFLVDGRTFDCVERMPAAFHSEAKAVLGDHVKREIIASMIELVTSPGTRLADVGQEMLQMRTQLAEIAKRHNLALLACGTHPFADWRRQTMTDKPRYDVVAHSLGELTMRIHVCGLHIHVGIGDPGQRISVMNRAQQFLPLFLALSTSSPFWRGASTGLKSYRSAANDESPRTGFPTRFADAGEFDRYVAKLTEAGFIPDQTFLWWAIRPSLKYPTLELRIADVCTTWRDSIAIAALYRSLVHALVNSPDIGAEWENHHYLVNNENRWQAIRFGLDAEMLDPAGGPARSVRERTHEIVDWLLPNAHALGCEDEIVDVLRILDHGTSAERQTATFDAAIAAGACPDEAIRSVAADIAEMTLAA